MDPPYFSKDGPFDDITELESRASSNYHSLQTRFQQRLDFGLAVLASYTWSKSIDDASNFFTSAGDPNFPQDSNNLRPERGRSNFDVRHRLSVSYSYDLPLGKGQAHLANEGWVSTLLSGWQTFGIVTLQSGRPFTVALLPEIDNSGTGRSALGFGANDRPNVAGNSNGGLSAFLIASKYPQYFVSVTGFPGFLDDANAQQLSALDQRLRQRTALDHTSEWVGDQLLQRRTEAEKGIRKLVLLSCKSRRKTDTGASGGQHTQPRASRRVAVFIVSPSQF